jgi:hypothetical protein
MFNRYSYVGNDPVNGWDPNGEYCNRINSGSEFCARSQRMADLHKNPRISSATTFALAASLALEELGSLDNATARFFTSPGTRTFLRGVSEGLEDLNIDEFSKISNGGGFSSGTKAQTDRKFVRMEQAFVQSKLDELKETNPTVYEQVVSESNRSLNSTFGHSKAFNSILDSAKKALGVDQLDFSNEDHRIAIGDATTSAIRDNQKVVCTGSRIESDGC